MDTILIQEADEATLDVVTTALEMEGYRVCSLCDNTESALELIRRLRPKLVLLDCWRCNDYDNQPGQSIKAQFPALRVVGLSSDNRIREKYRQLGFDDYINKPFDLEVLYRVVRRQIGQSAKQAPELQTQEPRSEKDQQGRTAERAWKFSHEAMARWRRWQSKLKTPLKK